jgi:arabinose-5-phosphate isomerase
VSARAGTVLFRGRLSLSLADLLHYSNGHAYNPVRSANFVSRIRSLKRLIMSTAATPTTDDTMPLLASGRRALQIEARAVEELLARIDARFADACHVCMACKGRVVVTGMGKSGHVARKIAATLASTGTPAFFLHPAEAGHGDLGMITRQDVVLALSNSGETPELVVLLPHLKRLAVPLIVMAGKTDSTLGRAANVTLDVSVAEEACPLNLAPTASTTATLAMGDALAVTLLEARGFTKQDFARSHPGGSLGRQLLLHVEDLMRTGEAVPRTAPEQKLSEGLLEMSRKGLGMTVIVGPENQVLGVFTDGDLRRTFDKQVDVHATLMSEVMTPKCKTIGPRELAAEAVHIMEVYRITALPVADEQGRLVGALNVHDLFRAGVV